VALLEWDATGLLISMGATLRPTWRVSNRLRLSPDTEAWPGTERVPGGPAPRRGRQLAKPTKNRVSKARVEPYSARHGPWFRRPQGGARHACAASKTAGSAPARRAGRQASRRPIGAGAVSARKPPFRRPYSVGFRAISFGFRAFPHGNGRFRERHFSLQSAFPRLAKRFPRDPNRFPHVSAETAAATARRASARAGARRPARPSPSTRGSDSAYGRG
jgi:hypothetical protein